MQGELGTDRRAVYTDEQDPSEVLSALWFRWTNDDGTTVDLPDGWRTRVRAVMLAGLTANELEECVAIAMRREGIRDPFLYAMGTAFKMLADRQDPPDLGISSFVGNGAKAAEFEGRRKAAELEARRARPVHQASLSVVYTAPVLRGADLEKFREKFRAMGPLVRNTHNAKVHRSNCGTLDAANPRSWKPYTWDHAAPPTASQRCGTCRPGPGQPRADSDQAKPHLEVSAPQDPDTESVTPEVFHAEELDICVTCQSPIEPGQPVAYTQDELIVHSQHHEDPNVRAAGKALGDRPTHRPNKPTGASRPPKRKSKYRRGKRR